MKQSLYPPCFGTPERCRVCESCSVKDDCFRGAVEESGVYLLPVDRAPKVKLKQVQSRAIKRRQEKVSDSGTSDET